MTLLELFKIPALRILLGISLLVSAVSATAAFMLADTEAPYIYHADKSFILPEFAEGGDQMTVYWRVTINRRCEGFTQRVLFDPRTGVILATYDAAPMVPKTNIVSEIAGDGPYSVRTFLLPQVIQKGKIGYRSAVCYSCNPLRRLIPVCTFTPDLFFEVR